MDRGAGWPCAEMQEIGQFLLIESLDFDPEPLDDFMFRGELAFVVSVFPPVLNIDIRHAIEDHLKLKGLKDTDKILGDNFIYTVPDSIEWPFNSFCAQLFDTKA